MSGYIVWVADSPSDPMSLQDCINFLLFNHFSNIPVAIEIRENGEAVEVLQFQ